MRATAGAPRWTWDPFGTGRSTSPNGCLVGGTIGYNYQTGSIVWGLEGDIAWSDVKGSVDCGLGLTCETANHWLGTARGRLGYAFDRLLPYVTGGAAFGSVQATVNPGRCSARATRGSAGPSAPASNMPSSATGRPRSNISTSISAASTPASRRRSANKVSFKENIVRAGLNYKFSGPIFTRW